MTSAPPRSDDPITLPTPADPARRGSIPIVASFVPVVGAVAMWLLTGHILMLCFAAIGPLMAVASLADGARGRRRERRRGAEQLAEACVAAREELSGRHDAERAEADRAHPDASRLARARTLWRHGARELVLGRGRVPSRARIAGGEGDEAERLRRDAEWVLDAPVAVGLETAGGVCVQGDAPLADAVVRALVVQLCLRASPRELVVTHLLPADETALADLPHARSRRSATRGERSGATPPAAEATPRSRGAVVRVEVRDERPAAHGNEHSNGAAGERDALRGGASAPSADGSGQREAHEADFVIAITERGAPAPPGCGVVLELEADGALRARRVGDAQDDAGDETIAVEALSLVQAAAVATELARRAGRAESTSEPAAVGLRELLDEAARDEAGGMKGSDEAVTGVRSTLSAVIGRGPAGSAHLDLVADGPHAVVIGMTGSGKSELLTTWITSLAATYPASDVCFLLADFKGGTAFTPLLRLPHVTGLITDLDGSGSRRAVESLRAELRRREAAIAGAGARDISDEGVDLPRLVIVVDEFAALLQEHSDLQEVFTDVAARGRALGMHLILGTQRAAGVVRDALLANCPLRVSLRVAEAADSRAVIGGDEAALLSGGAASRGMAFVRRSGDSGPQPVRIALTDAAVIDEAALGADAGTGADGLDSSRAGPPAAPWLPPLPERIPLDELRRRGAGDALRDEVLLGLADEPERQRQGVVRLRVGRDRGLAVIGGAGTGKTLAARLVASQQPRAVVVPRDAELAWDTVETALQRPSRLFVVDDVDTLVGRYPPEYAQEMLERLESIVRDAGETGTTVVLTAARASGPVARVLDLLPRRALLRLGSRADHVQAGGAGGDHDPRRPPGRAVLDGLEVQLALCEETSTPAAESDSGSLGTERTSEAPSGDAAEAWRPEAAATAMVANAASARAAALAQAWGRGTRVVSLDALAPGSPLDDLAAGATTTVVVGDGDSWLRHGGLLAQIRAEGDLVVAAESPSEMRTIARERALPPYARTRARRAWLMARGEAPRRVVLPA